MDNDEKTLVAFVLGLAAGALIGLAVAPESGKKNRQKINDSANDALYDLEDVWEEGVDRIRDVAEAAAEELERYSKKLTKNL
ncbi:YtxH domain-containing protein [Tunicatimonas pelagia]|uniref:YtxH domain-containing protein n=1 Tax=Tunicatimonas pelagia TaxID=931531 RepID=UPI0026660EF4|nr:YtxH domain-containing protein [Tunicatimonas pelagia]WKN41035.1 YtxH domain-containing protein [Tunicatimonas pelagia]